MTCSIDLCTQQVEAWGWCPDHLRQLRTAPEHLTLTVDLVRDLIAAMRTPGWLAPERQRWCADVMEALLERVDLPGQGSLL